MLQFLTNAAAQVRGQRGAPRMRGRPARRRVRRPLTVERLEDRCVPSLLTNTPVSEAQLSVLIPNPPTPAVPAENVVAHGVIDDAAPSGSGDCEGHVQSAAYALGRGKYLYAYQLECHCTPNWDVGYAGAGGGLRVPLNGNVPVPMDFNNDGVAAETSFHTTDEGFKPFVTDLTAMNDGDDFSNSPEDFATAAEFTGTHIEFLNADGIITTGDVVGFVTTSAPIVVNGVHLGGSSASFDLVVPGQDTFVFLFTGRNAPAKGSGMERLGTTISDAKLPGVVLRVFGWPEGRSPEKQFDEAAAFVQRVLKRHSADANDRVVLIGHSYGGHIAYKLARQAARDGNPIEGLVAFDPIDWGQCRGLSLRPFRLPAGDCDQSNDPQPAPRGIPTDSILSFVQRGFPLFRIQGYKIVGGDNHVFRNTTHTLIDNDCTTNFGADRLPGTANVNDDALDGTDDENEACWPGSDDVPLGVYPIVLGLLGRALTA